MPRLTKRTVDAAKPGPTEQFLWCSDLRNFGCRIYPSGRKVFVVFVRVGRHQRRMTIGQYGPFTVDQAREKAGEILRVAADGQDPQIEKRKIRDMMTVRELCDEYLEAARAGLVITRFRRPKRQSTVTIDEGMVARHINPLIGSMRVNDVDRVAVQRMADQIAAGKTSGTSPGKRNRGKSIVKGGPGIAARSVELLGGIWTWADRRGFVEGQNPAHGIETRRGEPRDRVLSLEELRKLGSAIRAADDEWSAFEADVNRAHRLGKRGPRVPRGLISPPATIIACLLATSGLRLGEATSLRYAEIDEMGHCLRLAQTKTGRSVRPIGSSALELIRNAPRLSDEWVFPNRTGTGGVDVKRRLSMLFEKAGIVATPHDLRRTFASTAAGLGMSDSTIAELLGHAGRTVTERHYIRRPDAALVAAANKVATTILLALRNVPEAQGDVVRLPTMNRALTSSSNDLNN